jgi:hypothetical protein
VVSSGGDPTDGVRTVASSLDDVDDDEAVVVVLDRVVNETLSPLEKLLPDGLWRALRWIESTGALALRSSVASFCACISTWCRGTGGTDLAARADDVNEDMENGPARFLAGRSGCSCVTASSIWMRMAAVDPD